MRDEAVPFLLLLLVMAGVVYKSGEFWTSRMRIELGCVLYAAAVVVVILWLWAYLGRPPRRR